MTGTEEVLKTRGKLLFVRDVCVCKGVSLAMPGRGACLNLQKQLSVEKAKASIHVHL